MSEEIKIVLPKLGESIHSATIVQWFKKIGDPIHLDEPLLEVSTDKVNSEIPSPVAGILRAIHAEPDQELQVGDLLAIVASGAAAAASAPGVPIATEIPAALTSNSDEMKDFFSPALLRQAREMGIGLDEMSKIPGTGGGGRVTKRDLETYVDKKSATSKTCPMMAKKAASAPVSGTTEIERLKMTGMRKAIAENMVKSFYEAPHATLVTEVDVTPIMKLIQREKEAFVAQHGAKLTVTSFVAHAVAKALQEFPLINSSLEGDTILVKRFVNIGIAVSIEQGLVVPVIKNCQRLGVTALAQAISSLSVKARAGKLQPDDVTEGTISMTNFGMSGVQIGVPIIRFPEVAIIGIGAICKRVIPMDDDVLAIRQMVHISLTFDHRVLDGMYGCGFLGAVKKHLEADVKID